MEQSKIEEIIDESFSYLIDTMFKFPENPYHINFEEIFFKGKADLIHRLEKIMNQKDKQIDLMAEKIFEEGIVWKDKEEVKQYFKELSEERKSEEC